MDAQGPKPKRELPPNLDQTHSFTITTLFPLSQTHGLALYKPL